MATPMHSQGQQQNSQQWNPKKEGIQQVLRVFRDNQSADNEVHQRIMKQLDHMQKFPEFNNYLMYVFAQMNKLPIDLPPKEKDAIRSSVGIRLKNNIKDSWATFPPPVKAYVRTQSLQLLADPSPIARNILATILQCMAIHDKKALEYWPQMLSYLVKLLDSPNPLQVDGAFNTIYRICEECPQLIDNERMGKPLSFLIPKFISMFNSPHESVRKYALGAINQFVLNMPTPLAQNMEKYLVGVLLLTKDPSKEVRKKVAQAFVMLLDVGFDHIKPHLNLVIRFMLHATQDSDEVVALEACEFWQAFCDHKDANPLILRPFLPTLVPTLLKGMVYSEMDILIMRGDEGDDDASVPDKASDIAPRHHAPARTLEPEESDDDWEDDPSEWNLRKCSAASLDMLANLFHEEILPILLPRLQELLANKERWEQKESGILALGAVSEGCTKGIEPYLKDLVPYLINNLRDSKPLIRSITCWTLSRYAKWVMQEQNDEKYFRPLMIELLKRVLDTNKKVQEAACSAFATLEEDAQDRLLPYLGAILKNLMYAFSRYQAKNMLILYDAISTLADAVGSELNKPAHIEVLMPPLMQKWNKLQNEDRSIFPLLECLTSIAQALGKGFLPFAPPVFQRCLQIIQQNLLAQQKALKDKQLGLDHEFPDKEFIVCALDLLSGIAEGLDSAVEGLVGKSNLLPLLYECIKDGDPDVRQSAFALLGDLAKSCIGHLKPHLNKYLPIAARNLNPRYISVCNNASWAIGEIAVKIGADMKPYVTMLMTYLIPIMNHTELISSLLENTAITIGRIGLVCPAEVAALLEKFVKQWCLFLARIRENAEKEHAFRGLCAVVSKNPKGSLEAFPAFCQAIASWQSPKPETKMMFGKMLHSFKNMLGPKWQVCFERCSPELQHHLIQLYSLK